MSEQIAILLCITIFSSICIFMESVLVSMTSKHIEFTTKNKKKYAPILQNLYSNLDRPLTALKSLNLTIIVFGTLIISSNVESEIHEFRFFLSLIVLLLLLLFSHLLARNFGRRFWITFISPVTYVSQLLIFIFYPVVSFSKLLKSDFALTSTPEPSNSNPPEETSVTQEEGTIKKRETSIINNLLLLNQLHVSDVMTPRSVIFALEASRTVQEVDEMHRPIRFSRLPVFSENLDNILGMTHRYKILETLSHDQHDKKIGDLVSSISTLSERMTVAQALDFFVREKEHIALAADEYGVTTGLVTLEDTIETLLGVEIVDEFDGVEDMRKYALEQWQLRKQKFRRT